MLRSRTTTSGPQAGALASASSPSPASPTISKSSRSRTTRASTRYSSLSSQRKSRIAGRHCGASTRSAFQPPWPCDQPDGAGPRRAALAAVACAAAALGLAGPARAATVLVGDVARPGAQAAAAGHGACDHALTAEEAAGAAMSPCAWPAPAGDWGPPLLVGAGEQLEVTLDAPATVVRATVTTTGAAPARAVLGPVDLTDAGDGRTWRLSLTVDAAALGGGSLGLALFVDG